MGSTLKHLLLLLLVLIRHVDSAAIVKSLPGLEGRLPFELETGYIGIGEEEDIQLFYYFIKSENNPKEDPLLLWLDGGPGCSSLGGLLFENGPVALKSAVYNGSNPSLFSTTYSWTKMANIIYLDQPVGSGFSYSRTPIGKSSDTSEVKRIHEFLQKWLSKHPQFFSNPFYVTGDSYSGMIVPALVQEISKGNYICCKHLINLQGYVLGNPITYAEHEKNYRIPFSHGMSLISDELYESLKRNCKGNYENVDPRNTKCVRLVEEYHKCTDKINTQHILIPDCDKKGHGITSPDCYYYLYFLIECWANNERVREALHVTKGTKGQWQRCNWTIPYDNNIISSVPYHMDNSINGYRSLIYSGDHDITMPFQATQAWIKSLNYSIVDDWRPWMINDQIAGYTRTYSNKMTFATVKGGGHTAEYLPNESSIMFQRWISGQPL
ncbi:Serine carboxypeptidase-like 10 [Arabidopsis thaliana]|jgi:serine carboxypeptidase-like clade 1|uniref:Serine carboxypeptidase-like 10 n=3 Tax=Arabidopsis TaxID=3701 RepID=SCP10_ARATH|nr:serine carboxypeptidase-like 10 [Arabidopsis thaliana]NP_179883.1 serine carboxypeptidase-like 10 [Arabidopsis thaliana]O64810.1 RecName: Full=Serine carboxypeptidase-like 10; AltName: Full=Sinapoylglucose--anthocyanin acyltransferase; AltName: Full=Sinapoylglucose--anthocyanin sinapoyltransferase; Short=SAT; Flags: Precursor [Arabidopsis thaliana]AAC17817.1 putative serine carboxypeptidase I [Arabidopsis thaliana]AEC07395.1 serine carboxypeptidase-like 10 [Arabidopsis thaliana]ANM62468.1 s|eukprot:NP_001324624.1 serine carboxypeptidase-like 10 [Arabidopsis thaliana]